MRGSGSSAYTARAIGIAALLSLVVGACSQESLAPLDPAEAVVSPGGDCIVMVEFRDAETGEPIAEPSSESRSFELLLALVNERDYLTFPMHGAAFRRHVAMYDLKPPCRSSVAMLAALMTEHNRRLPSVRASFSERAASRYDMTCDNGCTDTPYCWLGESAESCPLTDETRNERDR